jgi:leucyl-tRNA synthetase
LVNLATKGQAEGTLSSEGGRAALRHATQTAVSLLFPFAPHVASELWEALGGERLWVEPWPQADEAFLVQDTVTVVVQVNGKLRDRIEAPAGLADAELVAIARERPRVAAAIEAAGGRNGARVVREVVVPDRLVNLVVA